MRGWLVARPMRSRIFIDIAVSRFYLPLIYTFIFKKLSSGFGVQRSPENGIYHQREMQNLMPRVNLCIADYVYFHPIIGIGRTPKPTSWTVGLCHDERA